MVTNEFQRLKQVKEFNFGYLLDKITKYFLPVSVGLFAIFMQIPWKGPVPTVYWTLGDFLVLFLLFIFLCQSIKYNMLDKFTKVNVLTVFDKLRISNIYYLLRLFSSFVIKKMNTWDKEKWQNWILQILQKWKWQIWLMVFTAWMTFSFFNGQYQEQKIYSLFPLSQALSQIPLEILINKYFGWWMMMFYFILGGILTKREALLRVFLNTLFISSAIINSVCMLIYVAENQYLIGYVKDVTNLFPFHIFRDFLDQLTDRTELGLFATFMVLLQISFLFQKKCHFIVIIPNLIAILLFGSKMTLLAFGLGLWCFFVHSILADYLKRYNIKPKYIFLSLLLLSVVFYKFLNIVDFKHINSYLPVEKFFQHVNEDLLERKKSVSATLELWKKAPFTGIGLGKLGFDKTVETDDKNSGVIKIDITPVTLLTEIGIIGVVIYFWFIIKGGRYLFRRRYSGEANELTMAMIMVLIALIAASFTIEVFYQRYIWLLWGMALINPKSESNCIRGS